MDGRNPSKPGVDSHLVTQDTVSRSMALERSSVFLFQVKLESNFASIVFAIMVLEGLGRSLDPKLDILEAAKPFLLKGPVSSH